METDIHFLSNEVIENGRDREAFASVASATETSFDQLIPLCFCLLATNISFAFSPLLLEFRNPNDFRRA